MRLEGIHHITAITGHAQRNVDFYAGVLGLRLVKKTVNQDDPTVYHLFYADEAGSPGADLTFFEYPGAAPGRAGAGMVHRIAWRVGSPEAIDFWEGRLGERGVSSERVDGGLRFADPEGLEHELRISDAADAPLIADHPEVPAEVALQGFDGARAYAGNPAASLGLLEDALGFAPTGDGWEVRGEERGGLWAYDAPHERPGRAGGGGGGDPAHVGRLAAGEQVTHGPPLASRAQGGQDVGQQAGSRLDHLGAQLVQGPEDLAVLGQLGLAAQAGLDVAPELQVGHVLTVDDPGQGGGDGVARGPASPMQAGPAENRALGQPARPHGPSPLRAWGTAVPSACGEPGAGAPSPPPR